MSADSAEVMHPLRVTSIKHIEELDLQRLTWMLGNRSD